MSTAASIDRLLAIAASQIGGFFPGRSPYGEWYGARVGDLPTYATAHYCAMFVSWCADRAGLLGGVIPLHAYTPSGADWFRARGRFTAGVSGIQRGDIWYSSCSNLGRISHVGIVEHVRTDGSFDTIEGNTAATIDGDQRNGRVVARKRRRTACSLGGFARPAYPDVLPKLSDETAATLAEATEHDLMLQRRLREMGLYAGELDGRRGPMQISSTAAYQRRQNSGGGQAGLTADGDWTGRTEPWYQWALAAQRSLDVFEGVKGEVVADGDYFTGFAGQVSVVQRRNDLEVDGFLGPVMVEWMRSVGSAIPSRP